MLTGPLLLPPLVLAALLVVSGLAKVRHAEATRSAFSQLELPRVLTDSPAPRVLPWAELALAAALLLAPPPLAMPVAVLALLLFLAYLAVIARALTFDHPVTCHCFGELGFGEVTRRTALRNVLLVVLAALTVWSATAERSVAGRLVEARTADWAWLGLVLLVAVTLVVTFGGTKGESAAVPEDDEADYVRQPIPFAALEDSAGNSVPLRDMISTGAVLLVFVSPGCSSCRPAIERLPEWSDGLGPVRVVGVVSRSIAATVEAVPTLEGRILHDPQAATMRMFGIRTPGAVLLGGDGLLAGGPVDGGQSTLDFVEDVRAQLVESGVIDPE